jgi:hypothetical protein
MDTSRTSFEKPAQSMKSRPFFFIGVNAEDISSEQLTRIIEKSVIESGYAGFAINAQFMQEGYLSEVYFEKYGAALAKAEELGIKMCLYDENGCPSGSALGQFAVKYPDDTVKRLDKLEWSFTGPGLFKMEIEIEGKFMGAAALNMESKEVIELKLLESEGNVKNLEYSFLPGNWKIMVFECVKDGSQYVDYLTASSVEKFLLMTHEEYYKRFSNYFGTVIDSAFYDEPTMMGEGEWMPGRTAC